MHFVGIILAVMLSGFATLPSEGAEEITFSLYFRWDKAEHDEEYISNKSALERFMNVVRTMNPEDVVSIDGVAYTSPEGVYEHNLMLSRKRAAYARNLLKENLPDYADKIHVRSGGEAWDLLRQRVADDPKLTNWWRRKILSFLDDKTISNDTRKWRLANWLGYEPTMGDMYNYLLRNHYPYLRNCVVVVVTLKDIEARKAAEQAAAASAAASAAQAADAAKADAANAAEEAKVAAGTTDGAAAAGETDAARAAADSSAAARADSSAVAAPADSAAAPADSAAASADSSAADDAGRKPGRNFRPLLGLSTNIPYDITYVPGYGLTSIPSFSVEYYPASMGRWTFGADAEWPMWKHWDTHRFMQINNLTLWARRYFKPAEERYKGLYLFGSVNAARFGIGFDEKGWEWHGAGAPVGLGHKWMLGRSRFFIDTGLALGGFIAAYDSYTYGNDAFRWYYYDYSGKVEDFVPRSKRWLWFGPTRAYISLGIDLIDRNRKK